jgi:hypothetical protein
MDRLGRNLIFLISQPRSGSSLLQYILGSHSHVHTLPETWIMLHFCYGLRPFGLDAEYNARNAHHALQQFLERLPGGEDAYREAVRGAATSLYGLALRDAGKSLFLDKTPRYYFIATELSRLFPRARFVFLHRNPLAVLSSIFDKSGWQSVKRADRRHDLVTAPPLLLRAEQEVGDQATVVQYEELVGKPETTVKSLCGWLDLEFEPEMLNYGGVTRFDDAALGDHKSVDKHAGPVTDYVDLWLTHLDTTQKLHLAREYVVALGEDTVEALGYRYSDLLSQLDSIPTAKSRFVTSWSILATSPRELRLSKRLSLALATSSEKSGLAGTLSNFARIVLGGR